MKNIGLSEELSFILRKAKSLSAKFLWFSAIAPAFFSSSCNDPSLAGLEVQPAQDQIHVHSTDTTQLIAYTVREDSLRSDETSLSLLGSYVDPVFGKASAGFYTQLRLPSNNADFGTNPVLDSVVLSLAYNGEFYGDTNFAQTVKVHELLDPIYTDSSYYSNQSFATDPVPLAIHTFTPRPRSKVYAHGDTLAPQILINLDPAFGQKILDQSAGPNLADNTAFLEFLKGIYVTVDNPSQAVGEGAVLYLNLISYISSVTLFYHNDGADSIAYPLNMGTFAARISHFEHDFSGTPVEAQINGTASDTETVFLRAMSGVSSRIFIPHLKAWNNYPRRVINKAELICTIDPGSDIDFEVPEKLQLVALDSINTKQFVIDELYSQDVYTNNRYYGGSLGTDGRTYRFFITLHVQRVLSGETKDHGLQLVVSGNSVKASRVIIHGPGSPFSAMKLRVTYTDF